LQDSTTPWIFKDVIELQAFNFNTFQSHTERMSLLEDLAKAIEGGDATQVESLLAIDSIDVNERLPRSFKPPPLVLAVLRCAACCVEIVGMLLSAGAHIDGVDNDGQTACFAAVYGVRAEVLPLLLAHRPNLEIKDNGFCKTPLQFAVEYGSDFLAVMLINAGAALDFEGDRDLCWLASRSTAAIQALLNRGVDVKQLRQFGTYCSPLHLIPSRRISSAELKAAVKMLIGACGVDLEALALNQQTCTYMAAGHGNDIALRCFIAAGADVNRPDSFGLNPLHVTSDYKCAVLLLAAGANVNARDERGRTALRRAMWSVKHAAILPAFVAAGADESGLSVRDIAAVSDHQVDSARRDISRTRLDLVRKRAMQVCIGLQSLSLDALQMCEILQHAFGPVAHLIAFHQWWKIATTVKFQIESNYDRLMLTFRR
jgi:ankyrin repeat protein